MPVDPQIRALLEMGTGVPATHTLPVDVARAQYEARIALMAPPANIAGVHEQTIDGPGGPLRIRIYTPHGTAPFPLLVFFHGSGFVLCSIDTHDGMCRNLCAGAGCVVASVDYRLAPEHKFPAGIEDCLHATRWAAAHAADLGADPMRIAIAGDSAGANMAAVTALRVRDEGGPPLRGQLLLYPVTGYHTPGTPSYKENAQGYGLTRDTMKWFWAHYLNDESESAHPHASPLRARDVSGLPPAPRNHRLIRPAARRGRILRREVKTAGVITALRRYDGVNHGLLFWSAFTDKAGTAWMSEGSRMAKRGVFADLSSRLLISARPTLHSGALHRVCPRIPDMRRLRRRGRHPRVGPRLQTCLSALGSSSRMPQFPVACRSTPLGKV
jgi:acetyl esterase